ncbi:hypothetical protein K3495_g1214 [Podosphaera aphanis]|nr:hypothetical protein K3495_g1214 [Podosphaera aphanis]
MGLAGAEASSYVVADAANTGSYRVTSFSDMRRFKPFEDG